MKRQRTNAGRLALVAVILGSSNAWAAPAPGPSGDLSEDPGTEGDTRTAEAQARFRLGVQLYAQGNPSGALTELRRAYALVPNYRILFNLGEVAYQCHDHAAALQYLSRYLAEGGARVPDARRREVTQDLAELRERVGYLSIEHPDPGLHVVVDDADAGTTPLVVPVPANVGRHRIDIVAPSGARQSRTVDIEPGATLPVTFATLVPKAKATQPATAALALAPPAFSTTGTEPEPAAPPPVLSKAAAKVPELPVAAPPEKQVAPPAAVAPEQAPPAPHRPSRAAPWITWTLAAAAGAGAAVTGGLAWSASRSLQEQTASYPVSASVLHDTYDREHRYALASDGLLAGTAVLSALALYFTLRDTSDGEPERAGHLEARADW